MEQYLTVNELWDVVSGVETEPEKDSRKVDFLRKQKAARAHIALHVSPSQLNAVRLESDPKRIWEELLRLNRPGGFGTCMALLCKLTNMKKDPDVSMSKWITSVRNVVRRIKDLKGEVPDEHITVILTNSLPESYAPLVIHLDTMEESARTLSYVITRLIGEECRQIGDKGDRDNGNDPIALYARGKHRDRSDITCFGCGEKGHFRNECQKEKETAEASRAPSHASRMAGGPLL